MYPDISMPIGLVAEKPTKGPDSMRGAIRLFERQNIYFALKNLHQVSGRVNTL